MLQNKITEAEVLKWIKESGIMLYSADRPNVYIHRHKKIGCYERFFVNFNVASGKLLVYTADTREIQKRVLFATTNKEDIQKRSLFELYHNVCGYRQGKIVYKRG